MMFSLNDAAEFIHKTIGICDERGGFIGVKGDMKTVNIYELAKTISDNVEIIGRRSEAEKFEEDLISEKELLFTKIVDWDYIMILPERNKELSTLEEPYGTRNTIRMTKEEMEEMVEEE